MQLLLRTLFEMIFPLTEDERLVYEYTTETFMKKLRPVAHNDICSLLSFKDQSVRAAIHLVKFHHSDRAALLLGVVLREYLQSTYVHDSTCVPVPLSKERLRERGYNQVGFIVQKAFLTKEFSVREDILKRIHNTKTQTSLTREEREHNVKNAFFVAKGDLVRGRHIILIDDVTTTGATLSEAKSALLQFSPASVTCVALAH